MTDIRLKKTITQLDTGKSETLLIIRARAWRELATLLINASDKTNGVKWGFILNANGAQNIKAVQIIAGNWKYEYLFTGEGIESL